MNLSLNPAQTSDLATLPNQDLHSALHRAREELNSALPYLSSTNEGPSDSNNLRGRVQVLESQLQALEHEVLDRMLRHEQTALTRFTDPTPQPPYIWHDLPPELEINVLSFLETADLVGLSESSQRGLARPARDLLRGVAAELQRLIADTPLLQELAAGASKPSEVGVGQFVVQLQDHLRESLSILDATRVQELVSLHERISGSLPRAQRPTEQRALKLIKMTRRKPFRSGEG